MKIGRFYMGLCKELAYIGRFYLNMSNGMYPTTFSNRDKHMIGKHRHQFDHLFD